MRFYSMKNKFNDTFNNPFPCENDKLAVYQIRMVINQKKEPEVIASDYSLFYVGEFDEQVGTFVPVTPLELVSDCSKLLVKEEK